LRLRRKRGVDRHFLRSISITKQDLKAKQDFDASATVFAARQLPLYASLPAPLFIVKYELPEQHSSVYTEYVVLFSKGNTLHVFVGD